MKLFINVAFFVVYVAQSDSGLPFQRPYSDNPGLYDDHDNVVVLTARNLNDFIVKRNYSTLLEFYNSFCGHCRRFAPKYKQLADSLHSWKVLKVAALDCSTDENNDICRQYEIMGYPSLRYFGPGYVGASEKNLGIAVNTQDTENITHIVAGYLMSEESKHLQWPNFTNLEDMNPHNLFNGAPDHLKYVVVIFEPENSTVGAQTILNFHWMQQMQIRHTINPQVAQKLGLETFNMVKIFQRNSDSVSISLPNATPSSLKIAIESFLIEKGLITHPQEPSPKTELSASTDDSTVLVEILKKPRHIVYQSDLEHALRYTIFHEIPAVKEISGDKLLSLQRYLGALSRYNPLGENGRRLINELKNFVYSRNEKLEGKEFQEKTMALEKLYTPIFSSSKWIGCIPSKPGLRGYTCGLWTLFHSMTVQAAEDDTAVDPLEVLHAMHGYVKFFFGCTDCSRHFQEMASRRKIWNVSTKDDAILWLWTAHNEVNNRLAGDQTEDPKFPKVQFPTKDSCSACHRQFSMSSSHSDHPNWDKIEVIQFLKNIHSPQNISRFGVDDESVLPDTQDKLRSKRMITSVFSDIDMRMGILLYVFCVGMMFVAVKLFLRKGYRKKPYMHGMLGKV